MWEEFEKTIEEIYEDLFLYKYEYDYENNVIRIWDKEGNIKESPLFVEVKNGRQSTGNEK